MNCTECGGTLACKKCGNEQQWISVEDRLPDAGEKVLVVGQFRNLANFLDEPEITIACFRGVNEITGELRGFVGPRLSFWIENVTHWMPLPAPPLTEGE